MVLPEEHCYSPHSTPLAHFSDWMSKVSKKSSTFYSSLSGGDLETQEEKNRGAGNMDALSSPTLYSYHKNIMQHFPPIPSL